MSSRSKRRNRQALVELATVGKDRPRCRYCGVAISRKLGPPGCPGLVINGERVEQFTMDHIIPRAHGGSNDKRNLLPACEPCNTARGNMPLDQFIASLGDKAVMTVDEAYLHMKVARDCCDRVEQKNRGGRR